MDGQAERGDKVTNSKYKVEFPDCRKRKCFGYSEGKCTILSDNNFGKRECPFFKTQSQIDRENEAVSNERR